MIVRDLRKYFFVENYCIYNIYDGWGTVIKTNVHWGELGVKIKDGKIRRVSVTKINLSGSITECDIFMDYDFEWSG